MRTTTTNLGELITTLYDLFGNVYNADKVGACARAPLRDFGKMPQAP